MEELNSNRRLMKSNFDDWDEVLSDQQMKLPQPPLEKPLENDMPLISLPEVNKEILNEKDFVDILYNRKSNRSYTGQALTLEELSFLLWATQGVKSIKDNNYATLRTVPSGGARHAFETYLAVNRVEGLKPGIYRYVALTHQLIFLFEKENMKEKLARATLDQKFVGRSAVTFIWSCLPYRGEWRYHISAHKVMLLDAGHICQNLYLACEAIDCGTCAIAAYDQKFIDSFLKLDGEDEFVIYLAPVGKV